MLSSAEKKVWKYPAWISRLFVLIMLGLTLYSRDLTAFMSVRIRKNKSGIKANFGVQPSVSMGWIFQIVFPEQLHAAK